MSLLYRGRETVTIYHAEEWISEDGNIMYRPSTTDVEVLSNCVVQLAAQSGTSARRAEQDEEGYDLEEMYRFRPPVSYTREIHFASQIEWHGLRWNIMGHPRRYNGSDRTHHIDYMIRRV
jgi:hypothetical protein